MQAAVEDKVLHSEKIYQKLLDAVERFKTNEDNLPEIIFLLGAVDSLRAVNGFGVPEIEEAFLLVEQATERRFAGCLWT